MTQIVEFRVTMTCICTHKRPILYYKAWTDMNQQWESYQFLTAKLEPSLGAISPVVDLHDRQKAIWKSRSIDISQWRQ